MQSGVETSGKRPLGDTAETVDRSVLRDKGEKEKWAGRVFFLKVRVVWAQPKNMALTSFKVSAPVSVDLTHRTLPAIREAKYMGRDLMAENSPQALSTSDCLAPEDLPSIKLWLT